MNLVSNAEVEQFLQVTVEPGGPLEKVIATTSRRIESFIGTEDSRAETRIEQYDGGCSFIMLRAFPVNSIISIYDDLDQEFASDTLIDSADYYIENSNLGLLGYKYGAFNPGRRNLKITYTCGYSSTNDVPDKIREAVLIQIENEHLRRLPQRFQQDEWDLLPEVEMLLKDYRRMKAM